MSSAICRLIWATVATATISACGGGGGGVIPPAPTPTPASTIINKDNYVDVAGVTIVAVNRIAFLQDLIDTAFELVLNTSDIPGAYPCPFGGTLSYSKAGTTYAFSAANCDVDIGGRRVVIQSGSMSAANPVVQQTTFGSSIGYFLTSVAVTFNAISIFEDGALSTVMGATNISATVTSPTTATGQTTGASVSVLRAGRTDIYTNIDVTGVATLLGGNSVTGGSLTLSSPRAPEVLTLSASGTTITAAATDNSQSVLSSSNEVDFALEFAIAGTAQETSLGTITSGPLFQSISRALQ